MSKLLISLATLGSGGAERVLSVLSSPLADNFDEVKCVLWEGGDVFYTFDPRIRIVSLPEQTGRKGRINQIGAFRRLVKKERPDLILSFLTPFNMLVILSTIGYRTKIVVSERTDPKRIFAGGKPVLWLRNLLYRRAVGILTQTEYAKSCYGGKLSEKVKVIFNPVTMTEEQVGKALKTKKEKLFITVGRLESVKDQTTMIEAFGKFNRKHPGYKLLLYGEGPMRQSLESLVRKLGLEDIVLMPGRNNCVWEAMGGAICFLLSSKYEGMSNSMIEAMCLGLPVVSTKVAGATDLIKDGQNGFLVDIGDSERMAECMMKIADNADMGERMGQEAMKVYELLRSDKITAQWVEYLKDAT